MIFDGDGVLRGEGGREIARVSQPADRPDVCVLVGADSWRIVREGKLAGHWELLDAASERVYGFHPGLRRGGTLSRPGGEPVAQITRPWWQSNWRVVPEASEAIVIRRSRGERPARSGDAAAKGPELELCFPAPAASTPEPLLLAFACWLIAGWETAGERGGGLNRGAPASSRAFRAGRASRRRYASPAMKRYHLTTFGCQMNEHDSERMKGMLESLGYAQAPARDEAELILFNTCSIREAADSRFLTHLGEARRLKRERPGVLVGVGGCWAQSVKEEVFERFPFVDVAFGPGQVHRLAEFLTSDSLSAQGYFEFEGFTGHLPARRERPFQGWVQISVGCNCACSYCIVPSTRGREASRPLGELLEEVARMASEGVREVTLLGQNVNSYGRDLPGDGARKPTFAGLLSELDAIEGIERIRYTSPHPKDMREDVIRAHAELESVCPHIHLPLQSGSSRILKAMRRTYDRARYLDRVAMIREHVPDAAITTDIIVGFPGESEEDFEQTLEVVEQVGYDSAFTFVFSPRRGTEAATIAEGVVAHPVKVARMERLVELVQREARARAQRFVGRTLDVLVEGTSRKDPERLRGRTPHNKVVNFTGLAEAGEITPVRIDSATSQTLAGEEELLARAR